MIGQLIPLLLCGPCFKLHNAFFKASYLIQLRRLRRLGRKCELLGGRDLSGQFEGFSLKGCGVPQVNSLSDFGSGRLVGGKDRIFSIRMRLD